MDSIIGPKVKKNMELVLLFSKKITKIKIDCHYRIQEYNHLIGANVQSGFALSPFFSFEWALNCKFMSSRFER